MDLLFSWLLERPGRTLIDITLQALGGSECLLSLPSQCQPQVSCLLRPWALVGGLPAGGMDRRKCREKFNVGRGAPCGEGRHPSHHLCCQVPSGWWLPPPFWAVMGWEGA